MSIARVLIVDDDKEYLSELQEMLNQSGYDTAGASDGVSALDIARSQGADIIILDIRMGGMDGFQVAERLKQSPETSAIPIIAASGYFTGEDDQRLMNMCGIGKCLKKPFNPLDLISAIESMLQKDGE